MERQKATDFNPEVFALFDRYIHGMIDRRGFLDGAAKYAVGGLTAAMILESLSPNYALAQQISPTDNRIRTGYVEYSSPQGAGTMRGYMARSVNANDPLPGILVVHENRGLNPYVEDVVRRAAVAGFIAFGPDALFPVGGYPGNDADGRRMQGERDRQEMTEDFVAAANFLINHDDCTGQIGAVGFCFGGGMVNTLAVRVPELAAGVPFYGGQPDAADVSRINASMLIQYASDDNRINAGWPDYEEALKANNVDYEMHMYPNTMHGFHNDSTPRHVEAAANLAWERTIAHFNHHLR